MSLKKSLKKISIIIYLIATHRKYFHTDKRHPLFKDPLAYFVNIFKQANPKNLASLDLNEGILLGEYNNKSYILKFRPGNFIESHIYISGIWEKHLLKIMDSYISDTKQIIIDIGANIGATSIPLAKKYPNATFHLFEPHPIVFNDLVDNVHLNKLPNVYSHNIAISDSDSDSTELDFYAQKNHQIWGFPVLKEILISKSMIY